MAIGGLLLLASSALFAADLSGIWTGQITDRNGDPRDVSFRFAQSGDAVSGKMYGDNESTPISEGKITGDAIRFVIVMELNGQISRTIYSGRIIRSGEMGGELELTRQREGATGEAAKPQTVRLRRVA